MANTEDPRKAFSRKLIENGDRPDYIQHSFDEGQLSVLGTDVETLPEQMVRDYCHMTSQLDLSFNKLRSLHGLEHFKFLKELVLDNNELTDDISFPHLKDLHTLTLNKNRLTDLHSLMDQLVEKFPNLTYLSLLGNKACPNELSSMDKDDEDYQRYRYYVLYKLPGLKFLDSTPVSAAEVAEAKRVGPYTLVVRPTENNSEKVIDDVIPDSSPKDRYTPLHVTNTVDYSKHQGAYGEKLYNYYGQHSQGNRFIKNEDL